MGRSLLEAKIPAQGAFAIEFMRVAVGESECSVFQLDAAINIGHFSHFYFQRKKALLQSHYFSPLLH